MKPITEWTSEDILELLKSIDRPTWIRIGVGSGIGILFILFIAIPAWFTRPGLKSRLADIQGQIQMAEILTLKKPQLLKSRTEAVNFIKTVKGKLFKPGETALLLGTISKLANESKVAIVSSSPKEVSEKFPAPFDTLYEANLCEFTLEGGYHEIGTLAARIESHPKLFRVQNFQIHPSLVKGKEVTTQMASLTVAAISLKEGSPP
ncbi:MAG: hypothetical protein EXS63_01950 [Candidatus Omnitrophica bacterium]|nr:hypothetical protein [Candidatus Omnitrophota bacterium]